MVLVDGLKYACAPCIKGHRSSSCTHTDRPLYEIKKKGRPVTQCDHCRKLRKTKQVHVKCSCQADVDDVRTEPPTKAKRKLPTSVAFPNGLKGHSSSTSPVPRQVQSPSISNVGSSSSSSCSCESSGGCACATPIKKKSSGSRPRVSSSGASSISTPPPIQSVSSCCSGKNKRAYDTHPQLQNADFDTHSAVSHNKSARDLPQILAPVPYKANNLNHISNVTSLSSTSTSTFPSISLWPAGVGICSCGSTCACPGCYEHGDQSTALLSSESCPYACATCSNCYGFGFASTSDSSLVFGSGGSHVVQSSDVWTAANHSDLLPLPGSTSSFNPVNSQNPPSISDCCGGSCKCSPQALGCECKEECCGCCFGCSCSEESDVADQDDCGVRGRLGFAISGERASCCGRDGDNDDKSGGATRKKRQKRQQ